MLMRLPSYAEKAKSNMYNTPQSPPTEPQYVGGGTGLHVALQEATYFSAVL